MLNEKQLSLVGTLFSFYHQFFFMITTKFNFFSKTVCFGIFIECMHAQESNQKIQKSLQVKQLVLSDENFLTKIVMIFLLQKTVNTRRFCNRIKTSSRLFLILPDNNLWTKECETSVTHSFKIRNAFKNQQKNSRSKFFLEPKLFCRLFVELFTMAQQNFCTRQITALEFSKDTLYVKKNRKGPLRLLRCCDTVKSKTFNLFCWHAPKMHQTFLTAQTKNFFLNCFKLFLSLGP